MHAGRNIAVGMGCNPRWDRTARDKNAADTKKIGTGYTTYASDSDACDGQDEGHVLEPGICDAGHCDQWWGQGSYTRWPTLSY